MKKLPKTEETVRAYYPEADGKGNWYIVEIDVPKGATRRMLARPLHQLVIADYAAQVFWEHMTGDPNGHLYK